MPLNLSEETLSDLQMTAEEVRLNLAVWLFLEQRISIGKAAKLSGMNRFEFQRYLTQRKLPVINYGINEVKQELQYMTNL